MSKYFSIHWQTTFYSQIELLPRLTIIYGGEDLLKGVAFEWLWFSLFVEVK